jgi:nitroreductase
MVCAAAVQNMLIAAQSLDVSSCWAYFPIFAFHSVEAKEWRKALRIPNGYKPCVAILLGYGDGDITESDMRYKNLIDFIL